MNDDFDDADAYAKRDDPLTSWEAADAFDAELLKARMKSVYDCLKWFGPCTNDELEESYAQQQEPNGWPKQTPQSIRSRRSELTDRMLVRDTGERVVKPSGRRAVVWEVVR